MKIFILCLLLLIGCTSKRDLGALQEALYERDNIYVDIDLNEVYDDLSIDENDYIECILIKSLILVDQDILYVFKDPSLYLKEQLLLRQKNSYIYEYKDCIIYMSHYDNELINLINDYLDEIDD